MHDSTQKQEGLTAQTTPGDTGFVAKESFAESTTALQKTSNDLTSREAIAAPIPSSVCLTETDQFGAPNNRKTA